MDEVQRVKPMLISRHVLPAALQVVEGSKGDVQSACHRLLREMHRSMGDDLVGRIRAANAPGSARDMALGVIGAR